MYVLKEAALYEVADYISVNVLHGEKVSRDRPVQPEPNLPVPGFNDPKKPEKEKDPEGKGYENLGDRKGSDRDKYSALNFKDKDVEKVQSEDEKFEKKIKDGSVDSDRLSSGGIATSSNGDMYQRSEGGVIYQRIRSIDSGVDTSVLLQGQYEASLMKSDAEMMKADSLLKDLEQLKSVEADNTLLVRPVVENQKKVPCETSDDSEETVKIAEKPKKEPCETTDSSYDDIQSLEDLHSQVIRYNILRRITDNFNQDLLSEGGRVIGTGGFGEVFLGIFPNGYKVAVKRLKDVEEKERQFQTELDSLTKYRHENIVSLFGYSVNGPAKCLVYEYLSNGSLEDRLMRKNKTPPLPVPLRLSIIKGTAEGIYFLNKQGIVHRDIKSPNVLLDDNFVPKVGDFATVRGGAPRGGGTFEVSTSVVIGTSAYLAPEAFNFDVSTKLDAYSYGVIILEVLTGLPPLDQDREEKDLKSHVEENDICDILDESGGEWDGLVVAKLMSISERCTEMKKKKRANIADIMEDLRVI